MCCKMECSPLNREVARAVLVTGQFETLDDGDHWRRLVEGTFVKADLTGEALVLSLDPAISMATQHEGKRNAGGVYFEIAARYAEKVNGRVSQCSTITSCGAERTRLIANYPELPLTFDMVCPGFRSVFTGEADVQA